MKLIPFQSPYIRKHVSVARMMTDVLIALSVISKFLVSGTVNMVINCIIPNSCILNRFIWLGCYICLSYFNWNNAFN